MLLLKLRCIQGQAERGSHRMYCPPVRLTLSLRLQSRVAEKPLLVVSKGENISDLHGVSGTSEPLRFICTTPLGSVILRSITQKEVRRTRLKDLRHPAGPFLSDPNPILTLSMTRVLFVGCWCAGECVVPRVSCPNPQECRSCADASLYAPPPRVGTTPAL